ncbi:unnamed protein product [Rotaria sp. Silwood1]|nr:unnamed protein product [Rotaria sp. Silwood1]
MATSPLLKRTISFGYPQTINDQEISIKRLSSSSSSSCSSSVIEDEIKILDETISEDDKTLIQELLQSNKDLKKEIHNIYQQLKHTIKINEQCVDQAYNMTSNTKNNKMIDGYNSSIYFNEFKKSEKYKMKALMYKQKFEAYQETINNLRKTIQTMEKRFEKLNIIEQQQQQPKQIDSKQYHSLSTDHRFIYELFHLCLQHSKNSSKSRITTIQSHQDMKTYIQQTFNYLIKKSSEINSNKTNHFTCKCSNRIDSNHKPSYQYCLDIIEQYQTLFDIKCFTHMSTSLIDLYYKHGELNNFIHAVSSTLGINNKNQKLLFKTLEKIIEDSKLDKMFTFKKLTTVKDMNEAMRKIHCYDNNVPHYHQFIEELADLLEVSKVDQIIPAIKTLKLLAHVDTEQQSSYLPRISSINVPNETYSNSFRTNSSSYNYEQSIEKQTE